MHWEQSTESYFQKWKLGLLDEWAACLLAWWQCIPTLWYITGDQFWRLLTKHVLMCFDAFVVCVFVRCRIVCVGFFPRLIESDFRFSVFVSPSSLFCRFQCFVSDVYLLDSCALSAVCALYVIWVQFYLKTGGCALCSAPAHRPKITVFVTYLPLCYFRMKKLIVQSEAGGKKKIILE